MGKKNITEDMCAIAAERLSIINRSKIYYYLKKINKSISISELSRKTHLPYKTTHAHIISLNEAGLVIIKKLNYLKNKPHMVKSTNIFSEGDIKKGMIIIARNRNWTYSKYEKSLNIAILKLPELSQSDIWQFYLKNNRSPNDKEQSIIRNKKRIIV